MSDSPATGSDRLAAVTAAVEEWKNQLINLGGRNQLLYYRDLKVGTLRLDEADPQSTRALINGKRVLLSKLFPATEQDPERMTTALKRTRTVWKKARENIEERGVETLFLALGMVTWNSATTAAAPNAPLFVNTLNIEPKGAGRSDFSLALNGEWEVNTTLLRLIDAEFGVSLDPDALLEGFVASAHAISPSMAGIIDTRGAIPGIAVNAGVVVGNFAYTKMPMVRDIEESVDFLAENDLIAAIAGDSAAHEAISANLGDPIDPSLPDRTSPHDEYLILDADSSQNTVINAVVDGRSVVIQGPPGTGKSQTIANLIATLTARNKKVLFVAEKRAAIEAVVKRLDSVGLGHLVLDLHGGISSKRAVAEQLGKSLELNGNIPQHDHTELHRTLATTRDHLNDYNLSLHRTWDPWGVSLWDVQVRLQGINKDLDLGTRFTNAQITALTSDIRLDAMEHLEEWAERTSDFRNGRTPWLGITANTADDVDNALDIARTIAHDAAPSVHSEVTLILDETGLSVPSSVEDWDDVLGVLGDLASLSDTIDHSFWELDLHSLAGDLDPARRGFWSRSWAQLSSLPYRDAKRTIREHIVGGRARGKKVVELVDNGAKIAETWIRLGGQLPPRLPSNLDQAQESHKALIHQLAAFGAYTTASLSDRSPADVGSHFRALEADQANLRQLPFIHNLETILIEIGLGPLIDSYRATKTPADRISAAFDLAWLDSIRSHILKNDPTLRGFNSRVHNRRVSEFRTADVEHRDTTAQRVARSVAEITTATANAHPEQEHIIRGEARRKTRHKPLRELINLAPDLLIGLRPCWVMSPLVVSQILPAKQLFDVVIFDEASQVLPADAIPALARAPQVVIAGDRLQLPPTIFFAARVDGAEPDDDSTPQAALTQGFESILDVTSSLLPEHMLTWHYRSQDEKLIAFSNYEIYGGGLTTFPGSGYDSVLRHELVPYQPGQDINTKSNPQEVQRVVDLIIEHAHTRPDETLGVIAMGIDHANRIDAALEERLRQEPDSTLEDFFSDNQPERPFIKNLERVQGDERDAIILSIGYSKDAHGRLAMRFGPINQDGGHRRLNVAVTRAKRRITLVSSFTGDEVDLSRTNSRGVEILRSYLKYVGSGGRELSGARVDVHLNPFELSVRDRLEQEGLQLIPQYGVSGFRIDFAVRHPEDPGRMILAIEADGASYHSSPTARDRDRLRQQVLEKVGWRFHRIWSTDWFNNKEKEVAKVMNAVHEALRSDGKPPNPQPVQPPPMHPTGSPQRDPRPRIGRGGNIDEYPDGELIDLIQWIQSDTLLRTDDELLTEAIAELGFRRRGKKIVNRINHAIRQANHS